MLELYTETMVDHYRLLAILKLKNTIEYYIDN